MKENHIKNSDLFLTTYNELERHLKKRLKNNHWEGFRKMVREGALSDLSIARYRDELLDFAELRNAIVHGKGWYKEAIAEPNTEVVKHFKKIKEEIMYPHKVSLFFKKVYHIKLQDPLDKALKLLRDHKISQLPVLENGTVTDILNTNTIAFWLALNQKIKPQDTTIEKVLEFGENRYNFEIIPTGTTVYRAAEIFRRSYKKPPVNWYYDAILITKTGRPDEAMKGIMVLEDIAAYM